MNTVREVLEYLLEHDDPWVLDPAEKFLCNRCLDMRLNGMIESELSDDTQRWIMKKIEPYSTLSQFYTRNGWFGGYETAYDKDWPLIRQDYLRQWIKELKETEHDHE